MAYHFTTLNSLKDTIAIERGHALRSAKVEQRWPFIRSRGTWLCTADAEGQCEPRPEADCPDWNGTLASIRQLVDKVLAEYPGVTRVYIAGGYDGGERMQDWDDGCYEPWVSSWDVPVWTRDADLKTAEVVSVEPMPAAGNLNVPAEQWLAQQFEFENCDECGRGAEGHDAVPLLGNWFARCKPAEGGAQ